MLVVFEFQSLLIVQGHACVGNPQKDGAIVLSSDNATLRRFDVQHDNEVVFAVDVACGYALRNDIRCRGAHTARTLQECALGSSEASHITIVPDANRTPSRCSANGLHNKLTAVLCGRHSPTRIPLGVS